MAGRGRRTRPPNPGEAIAKEKRAARKASRELVVAERTLTGVRTLYMVLAGITSLIFLILLIAFLDRSVDVDLLEAVWPLLLIGGIAVLLVQAARQVHKDPVTWSGLAAALATAFHVIRYEGSDLEWVGRGAVLGLWGAVYMASRAQALMRRFPDLSIARRMRGGPPEHAATKGADARRARMQAQRAHARKRLLIGAGVVGAVGAVLVAMPKGGGRQPGAAPPRKEAPAPPFDATLDAFLTAWNRNRVLGLQDFALVEDRARRTRGIKRALKRRGWEERLPTLQVADIRREGLVVQANFTIKGYSIDVQLRTRWECWDGKWYWRAHRDTWPSRDARRR